jgi:hypothetical protein
MAKFIWKEELTEAEFIETFGENPGWILSPAPDSNSSQEDNTKKPNSKNINRKDK